MEINIIYNEDSRTGLKKLHDESVDCCVTSPPYFGLRDYGHDNQIGLESTPEKYVENLVQVFREVKRVLKLEGTLWLNLGDSYAGSNQGYGSTLSKKQSSNKGTVSLSEKKSNLSKIEGLKSKDLIGIPWMIAFALRADGWYLRQDIIWHKPNPMPESVTDRCTKAHEYIFLLSKSQKYYFDSDAIKENSSTYENRPAGVVRNREYNYDSKENNNPQAYKKPKTGNFNGRKKIGRNNNPTGNEKRDADDYIVPDKRNKRSVWTINTKPYKDAHFAVYPEKLIEPAIKAGCPEGGIVLDPFSGSNRTGIVSLKLNRNYISYEINTKYIKIAKEQQYKEIGLFQICNSAKFE